MADAGLPGSGASEAAPGRIPGAEPVAVIDIGSNSVRLVVYEDSSRAPAQLFNEKVLCGLGRGVGTTGRLRDDSVALALGALRRFRGLIKSMQVTQVHAIATAAARDAENGPDFIRDAEAVCGNRIEILSGKREASLAALGVVAGIYNPEGIAGDLGGGSLEMTEVSRTRLSGGVSLPLGAIVLQERSGGVLKKAAQIVRESLDGAEPLRTGLPAFYAIGGTWRAFARLHMRQKGYPLSVMHNYAIPAREAIEFARLVQRVAPESLQSIESITAGRRPLLAYGALVLEQVLRKAKPRTLVISADGVREGLLFERLDEEERAEDPLLAAARDLGYLRSRSPAHGEELVAWTDQFFTAPAMEESREEKRLRHAACLLSDISWRAHPDYRGAQSLNTIAHGGFVGIDHPGRAFLALSVYSRHTGNDEDVGPGLRELLSARMIDRARTLGLLMRIAYMVSAGMPGSLPRCPLLVSRGDCVLGLPFDLRDLAGDRLLGRTKQLGRLAGLGGRLAVASQPAEPRR